MAGFLLIDKPTGPTSHDLVDRVRRITGEKRVGHAGTLDPFASGLLIIGVGREATREFSKIVGLEKTYETVFVFGAGSDTDDKTGTITHHPLSTCSREQLQHAVKEFTGTIEQVPPHYAAIKIGGKKLYESAREGKPMTAPPRTVTITEYELLSEPTPGPQEGTWHASFRVTCSSGTYIRALARDLGRTLGTEGYVETLRRTRIGPFSVANSLSSEDPSLVNHLIPVPIFLSQLPSEAA